MNQKFMNFMRGGIGACDDPSSVKSETDDDNNCIDDRLLVTEVTLVLYRHEAQGISLWMAVIV